jgi:ABC-type multidrug transport system fused ATPase/permease subunit
MFKIIKELFNLLTPSQRKRFYVLQILVAIMAVLEIFGVASMIPFMAVVGDMSQLQEDTPIAQIYKSSGITSESQFVFILGVFVLLALSISTIISMFTVWKLSIFAHQIGTELADRLYTHYLKQGWLFHASGSSAQLTKKIATETTRVTANILVPLMHMNSKILLVFLLSLSIIIYNPKVAIIGISIFVATYLILFRIVRTRLASFGKATSDVTEQRFRLMNEGFGGIKDVLLLGRDADFIGRFNKTGNILAYSLGTTNAIIQIPRYLVELIAFGSIILLILYLMVSYEANLGIILPILSIYAVGAIKLLPAFQQIYGSIGVIKANLAAFDSIRDDLNNSFRVEPKKQIIEKKYLNPKQQISLENIAFTYPNKEEPTLNQLSMTIPANSVIGVVGPSGAGKSTLIDIFLGLIEPQEGQLIVDHTIINGQNLRSWQNSIGFVAQSIFLSEGTIAENIAFGISHDQIDLEQVQKVIKLAYLDEFIQTLNDGVDTRVGERGVQLSGGQRQRIGIARALYHKAEVIVFDEATSSLDGVAEKMIMDAIHDFSGQKTIILIAHRLKTVQKCDKIFFINNGKVDDQGTYQELLENNEHFKNMAMHA